MLMLENFDIFSYDSILLMPLVLALVLVLRVVEVVVVVVREVVVVVVVAVGREVVVVVSIPQGQPLRPPHILNIPMEQPSTITHHLLLIIF